MSDGAISLDEEDLGILRELQRDCSRSVAEIARIVGMSQTPCWRRIKRMREAGVIRSSVCLVDREAAGLGFVSYALVSLATPNRRNMEAFEQLAGTRPEVVLCERLTGGTDYLLKVIAADIGAYDDFLRNRLLVNELVGEIRSHIVLSTVRETTELPLTR